MMSDQPSTGKQKAAVFPKQRRILETLGENICLARKRRNISQKMMAQRSGLNPKTIRKIEQGDPGVSIGHYLSVLSVLKLVEDLRKVAKDDELGRKLDDIRTLGSR